MPDCSVCIHPQRAEIDKALASNTLSVRDAAGRYRLKSSSVGRHAKTHLPARVKAAVERAGHKADVPLVERVRELEDKAREWMQLAEQKLEPDASEVMLCLREARACMAEQAKLLGAYAPAKVDALVVAGAIDLSDPRARADRLEAMARALRAQLPEGDT